MVNNDKKEEELRKKYEKRDKKQKKQMKVSGKSVFGIQKIRVKKS